MGVMQNNVFYYTLPKLCLIIITRQILKNSHLEINQVFIHIEASSQNGFAPGLKPVYLEKNLNRF